jgi:hypothetical protein
MKQERPVKGDEKPEGKDELLSPGVIMAFITFQLV